MKQTSLNPRADVLEGHRRPMKQLEDRDAIGHLDEWKRKVERFADQWFECLPGDFILEDMGTNGGADLDDVRPAKAIDGARRQRLETLGHVEPAIRRGAGEEGVDERNRR